MLAPPPAPPPPLSGREQAILQRLADGKPCAAIAAELGISERQLRRDTAALRRRLGAHSLRHLAARARELDGQGNRLPAHVTDW